MPVHALECIALPGYPLRLRRYSVRPYLKSIFRVESQRTNQIFTVTPAAVVSRHALFTASLFGLAGEMLRRTELRM